MHWVLLQIRKITLSAVLGAAVVWCCRCLVRPLYVKLCAVYQSMLLVLLRVNLQVRVLCHGGAFIKFAPGCKRRERRALLLLKSGTFDNAAVG